MIVDILKIVQILLDLNSNWDYYSRNDQLNIILDHLEKRISIIEQQIKDGAK